jgi:hypothetical protein
MAMNVLNISTDPDLLVVSIAYLSALGFEVVGVHDLAGVRELIDAGKHIDLLILCHTLNDSQKRSICELVTERIPLAQVLELYMAELPVTEEVAAHATIEFLPLMRILASDKANSEGRCYCDIRILLTVARMLGSPALAHFGSHMFDKRQSLIM